MIPAGCEVERGAPVVENLEKLKGLSSTKKTTESRFSTGTQLRYDDGKKVQRVLENALFFLLGKRCRQRVQITKNYGGSKILRSSGNKVWVGECQMAVFGLGGLSACPSIP